MTASAFHHSGGDLLWGGCQLAQRHVDRLQTLFAREAAKAAVAGSLEHYRAARKLQADLSAAVAKRDEWRRAFRPIITHGA